ncbi:hypothetical protein FACS1894122_05010 [Alphaproteobacteria bacterium]|nr:hypothetical protein FACS1894122_05010 [Alphaproteobacteria bacterium]
MGSRPEYRKKLRHGRCGKCERITDVVESVNAYLANLKSLGAIIDGKCFANDELNTPSNIADGKIYFDFEFVPSYPAEKVTFRSYLDIGLNSTFLAV